MLFSFFFFKQKTAYEMRISDWSSDVCSSDLLKAMHIDYQRRARGALRATATLSPAQRARIAADEKGELVVPVQVEDESGEAPIAATMTWAWVPKKRDH